MPPEIAEMIGQNIALIVLALVILFAVSRAVRIVPQSEKYVVERFGQIRVVGKQLIGNVTFAGGNKPSGLTAGDHILLKNGHVLVGTIVEEKESPGLFRLDSRLGNKSQFIAFKTQIASVYKDGKPYAFEPGRRLDYKVGEEYRSFEK